MSQERPACGLIRPRPTEFNLMIEIALYQPDIAQNTGAIARMCACFGLPLTIIEPAGFAWTDARLRRGGMDYLDLAMISRADSWTAFQADKVGQRRVLLTTKASAPYLDFAFQPEDILLLGRESSGVPAEVHEAVTHRITIPIKPPARSLNVALAAAIVASEALRQLGTISTDTMTPVSARLP
jgi:tRNA (cytidine/uridine-2'-O-)-methyltransferase